MRYIKAFLLANALFVSIGIVHLAAQTPSKPAATPSKPTVKNSIDKGDFKVGFSPVSKAEDPKRKDMPKDEKESMQELADALNSFIALPRDIYLNLDTCGEANAYYSSGYNEIKICYELLEQAESIYKTVSKDPKVVDDMIADGLVQTLFHELGHCLIDVWELPATGREEDAVDQLSVVLMLDGTPSGDRSVLNAATWYNILARKASKADLLFWDEHSFDKTRFYDMLCMVYGSSPDKNFKLVGPRGLPEGRAGNCPADFQRINRAWLKLLEPYILK